MHSAVAVAQINTEQVLNIGRNALYFDDYILAIQYFNQVIAQKPYLAEPYYYRAVANVPITSATAQQNKMCPNKYYPLLELQAY